jgi:hypothetical protein
MVIRRKSRLTDTEIIDRYAAGESVGMICLRAKVPDYHITAILTASGVRLRGPAEALRLAMRAKMRFGSTRRMHKRLHKGLGRSAAGAEGRV